MPMPKVIPPEREDEILARAGRGESAEDTAKWLTTELGRKVDGRRVREFLEKGRKERAPITAAIVAKKTAKTVTSDLDEVEAMLGAERSIVERVGDLDSQLKFLKAVQDADITKCYDPQTGAMLAFDKLPQELKLAIHSLDSEQLFDGTGEDRYRAGDVVKVKLHDKLRAVELINRIRREASEARAKLLELRLKLAGAGAGNADDAREHLLAALDEEESKKD